MTERRTLLCHLAAGALIAAFFLQSFLASRIKSPTSDEPPHIAAGLSYVEKNNFRPNPQHPPLIKELSAFSLLLAGIHLPDNVLTRRMLEENEGDQIEWLVGNEVIAENGPATALLWARLPVIVLSTLLALLIYIWGLRIAGNPAALGALLIFALDPNLLAHSAFVTTDMGLAVFGTLFFFVLWLCLRSPNPVRVLCCGLTLGLALCAKFSAVFMIPPALVLTAVPEWRILRGMAAKGLPLAGRLIRIAASVCAACGVACLVILAVYRSPDGLSLYWRGLNSVYADHNPDHLYYMAGWLQKRFYSYFAVAWLLKEPVGTVALVLVGSVALLRNRSLPLPDKLFLFLLPATLFAAATFWAHDIGIRYIIPAFPFACLAGGAGLAYLLGTGPRRAAGFAGVLVVWMIVAAAGIYPDNLSYFNEAACLLTQPAKIGWDGGSKCGPWWLDDSNVDWGQGLVQLSDWMKAHPDPRTPRIVYFGSFPPEVYGIEGQLAGIGRYDLVATPGLYAISAQQVARYYETWLRIIPPVAIVGHAYYIYDIRYSRYE